MSGAAADGPALETRRTDVSGTGARLLGDLWTAEQRRPRPLRTATCTGRAGWVTRRGQDSSAAGHSIGTRDQYEILS